ncbi:aminotransferase class V-fold PLP-dependent enzyme [Sphingomicrobium lutaoense]|uniref:Selenocysteine lyase/cysteine desulfurase n=1 Tax=Sphingomicrobium lutaoense TaxID=515949 RepID=A0A839Z2J8_9SPHN|nr:aminotransferase class V-fold PLP-dependent enzyme [Sphingomicrobium lutaoense]MBB3764850.1 selenocysteine lyase/cysteine desulfurase [Sphingomicrobium lutaoense]
MSFKPLFSKSLSADPDRLHFAAHSHHLWPDASFAGQVRCWEDAARLADRKWDRVMGEIWPAACAEVGRELGHVPADRIVFAGNTHDFLVRLAAAAPQRFGRKLHILTSDGEFHSARRQFARWVEEDSIRLETIPALPAESFSERFTQAAATGDHDLVLVSQVMFGSGRIASDLDRLVELSRPEGPWVVIDGYHAFMAIEEPFPERWSDKAFYLAGGYKYAMAGEGMGFMSCPPGYGERPPITGWYAEFEDLTLPPGMIGYARDAMRFMGATFDPSALYRFLAVREALAENGLDTARISGRVARLHAQLVDGLGDTVFARAELLNPLDGGPHARFLAYRHPDAARWCKALGERNCIVDVRGEVIRLGLGLYHDEEDIDRFAALARVLA